MPSALILIDCVYKKDEHYYPKVFLQKELILNILIKKLQQRKLNV